MGLLNLTTDGLPSVGITVVRLLAEHGPRPLEDIVRLCDPPGLNGDSDSMVRKTVKRWLQLGVFTEGEDGIHIATECGGRQLCDRSDPMLEKLRAGVLRAILATAKTPLEKSPADDLIVAAWWFLQLDPTRVTLDSAEAAIREASRMHPGREVLKNNTRWPGLIEWASFLGLGTTLGGALVPNPTAAVRWALEELGVARGVAVPALDFVTAVIQQVPLFGNGAAAQAVADRLEVPVVANRERHKVSPSLSLALSSLRSQGVLDFQGHQDALTVVLLDLPGGGQTRIENVTVLGGTDA